MTAPATARELLVYVAGDDHTLHSIVSKSTAKGGVIKFICTCGETFKVAASANNSKALRNVVERK